MKRIIVLIGLLLAVPAHAANIATDAGQLSTTTFSISTSGTIATTNATASTTTTTGAVTATGGLGVGGAIRSGDILYSTSSGTPTAAVNTISIGGGAAPTLGASQEGGIWVQAANGLLFQGRGATNDVGLLNQSGALALNVPANTTNVTVVGNLTVSGLTTGTNANFVCTTSGKTLLIQASACTISSMRFKNLIGGYKVGGALNTIIGLDPIVFTMKVDVPNEDWNYDKPQIGLSAENVAAIEPRCAIYEQDGKTPKSYRQECLIAVLVAGMKEQQAEIALLKKGIR